MKFLDFYKERYYKEIERKNEITSSFSTPIGIISALVAAVSYMLTSFEFSISVFISILFISLTLCSIILLGIAVYNLIKALSDFHNGFQYAYLNNADKLDNYHKELKVYHSNAVATNTIPDNEFEDYILNELIKSSSINQTNNDIKTYHRFICNKFMVFAFITICISTIPFGVNFGIKKTLPNIQKIEIDSSLNLNLQTKQNFVFLDSLTKKLKNMADEKEKKVEKPIPPATKMLTEGVKPTLEKHTFSSQEKDKKKDDKKKE